MQRALEVSVQAIGLSNPNPPVGAVLVRDDEILAEVMEVASTACNPINDKRGTVEYRRQVAGVLVKRVILLAEKRALDKRENK